MKRYIAAVLSILGVAAGVGWKLASHPETSAGAAGNQSHPALRALASWPDQRTGRHSHSLESQRFRLRASGVG